MHILDGDLLYIFRISPPPNDAYGITVSCPTTWKIRHYTFLCYCLMTRRLFCHKTLIVQFIKHTYGHWVGSCGWGEHNTLAWKSSINFTQKPFWSQSITNVISAHCLGIGLWENCFCTFNILPSVTSYKFLSRYKFMW
jgi:hypothetical protein